ncbi:MAG: HEPN domain-containing protein [Deltaproteobacteria bacterium]|nr:HEPN domain-containing protein [Deltaproteobacteria bacterium]
MRTILRTLESQGSIEKATFGAGQISSNLSRARKDLLTAKATVTADAEWAYTIAYHAMLRAGRALMFSLGFRPKGKDQHKTVAEFCTAVLGEEYKNLTARFNRMRVKRHDFIYEPERPIPRSEAAKSIESAERFVKEISAKISRARPQEKLFP